MPTLLPQDQQQYNRILWYLDSLLYAANFAFMRGPARSRRDFVQKLRNLLSQLVPLPGLHATNDRDLYQEMLLIIRALRDALTARFMQQVPPSRKDFVDKLLIQMFPIIGDIECGDLCPDKEKGCSECPT